MPSVQLAFGHLIQCNINEIIQRTTTCLLLTSVAPGGHGKSMVQYRMVPHGTVGVYLSLTLTFGIENSSHPFLTLISDHIPYIVYHVNHVNYGINRSPLNDHSGIRITLGKNHFTNHGFVRFPAMARGYTISADHPHLRPCEDLSRYVPESVGAVRAAPGD